MSYADDFTEEKLLELEKKINKVYSEAQKDLEKQAKDYFEQFAKRDEEYKKLVDSGEITKDDYKQWRLNQIGRGERINKMAANMAERATQANEVAMAYVNDATPTIYSLNRNHEAYVIEQLGHDMTAGGDFTLYNESSVRRMLVNEPEVMPYYPEEKAVARGIDLEYGQKVIKAKTTSGILQGKSVYKIADDLQRDITNMNRVSAVRAARTAITSAQNGGRQDTMLAAQKMGIKLRKRWVSAKDGRVRDAHGAADGQTVNVDEPFIVGGEKLMFPGDKTSASGWNLYNCRCGMRTVEKEGIEAEQRQVRIQNPKYTEAKENEEKAKARYERAKAKEDAETDPEKKKALRKDRLEKQKEYEQYSAIRKGTQKNIVVNGDMTYSEWEKLRGKTSSRKSQNVAAKAIAKKPQFTPAKTKQELNQRLQRLTGASCDFSGLDLSLANEYLEGYEDFYREYPALRGFVDKMDTNVQTSLHTGEYYRSYKYTKDFKYEVSNSISFTPQLSADETHKMLSESINKGFHFDSMTPQGLAKHECTHALDDLIGNTRKGYVTNGKFVSLDGTISANAYNQSVATEILDEVRSERYDEWLTGYSDDVKYLGDYAMASDKEMLAQCIAYEMSGQTNPFSAEVKRRFDKIYKEILE